MVEPKLTTSRKRRQKHNNQTHLSPSKRYWLESLVGETTPLISDQICRKNNFFFIQSTIVGISRKQPPLVSDHQITMGGFLLAQKILRSPGVCYS